MPGRHRQLHRTGLIVTSAAAAVLVVSVGSWAGYRQLSGKDCATTVTLKVAAAAEIAPAVRTAAARWADADDTRVQGSCIAVQVDAADPPTMAAAIAGEHGVSLLGVGAKGGVASTPDVWIPDSKTWLLRLASEATGFVPADGGSIAKSPIVLAAPSPTAKTLGWPGRTQGLKDLVARIATDKSLRPGIVDPARDAAGLSGLLALSGAAGTDATGAKLKVGVMRAFAANSSSIRADMLQKFPRSPDDVSTAIGMAPLSEEDVIAYNAGRPEIELAALYPSPTPPALDYPFAVMPGVDLVKSAAAAALHQALSGAAFADELAVVGLRAPDGRTGRGFAVPSGAPASLTPAAAPKDARVVAGAIGQLLGSWTAITQPGRMLAVFDVSGSMKEKVPTAGGMTRAQVTQGVAVQGLALLDDRWAVGNWTFSTNMDGKKAYIENVPVTPLSTGRAKLREAITKIVPKDGGDTGLFETALAAYQEGRDGWVPGLSNSVVIYTDGKNDNPGGMEDIDELVSKMTKLRDPRRPVRMIIIGIGTGVDRKELETIAKASGSGGVYVATDPAKIGEIFLQAIASRSGA